MIVLFPHCHALAIICRNDLPTSARLNLATTCRPVCVWILQPLADRAGFDHCNDSPDSVHLTTATTRPPGCIRQLATTRRPVNARTHGHMIASSRLQLHGTQMDNERRGRERMQITMNFYKCRPPELPLPPTTMPSPSPSPSPLPQMLSRHDPATASVRHACKQRPRETQKRKRRSLCRNAHLDPDAHTL